MKQLRRWHFDGMTKHDLCQIYADVLDLLPFANMQVLAELDAHA